MINLHLSLGIRLGTAAITTRGFKEAETTVLGNLICEKPRK